VKTQALRKVNRNGKIDKSDIDILEKICSKK